MTDAAPRVRVVAGSGRYADPWHDFAATSAALADLLRDAGCLVEVRQDVDDALADLTGVDLVVIDIGRPADADADADARVRRGLLAHLAQGRPLLALHVSATSLPGTPEWEDVLGGIWVRGTTMHPDQGVRRVEILRPLDPGATPGTSPVGSPDDVGFDLDDEFYTYMRVHDDVEVVAQHRFDEVAQPLVWRHEYGTARVVYDALGHVAASIEAEPHRELLTAAARWLLASPAQSSAR